ncbi:hypothetical protein GGX14DRAFT_480110 [Mycena pura]|uniref:F-box domain-containing protein n=1 Tax=Mycena pura TaxID=153505 RepID=A0AAD6UQK9_9AGAR|nr:hypothetical protein GGX14DRAFT_480110 [Mycena pura]
MSTLPLELEDLIIDHIRGDKKTMASCGLVSRAWLQLSRPNLFGSVTLRDHTYKDFLRLKASRRCTFIPSIRTLSISRPEMDTLYGMDFTELIPKLAGFPSLLSLRVFYVCYLSADSVNKFLAVFHDITQLHIHGTTFEAPHHLIALLARLPRLEMLTVRTMFRTPATGIQKLPGLPMPPDPPRSLQVVGLHLEYGYTSLFGSILKWIAKGPPPIRTLRLSGIWPDELPYVGNHLRTLGPTLRDLDLHLVSSTSSQAVTENLTPHLACLAHVAHLTVRVGIGNRHWNAYCALLAALPHEPAALETLTIFLDGHWVYLDGHDWVPFYAAVHVHTQLRLLRIRVDSGLFSSWAVKEILSQVDPEFAARASVEVELSIGEP